MKTLAPALVLTLALAACQPSAPPAPSASAQVMSTKPTRQQAIDKVAALPELKQWAARIEKDSGGKLHGAVIEFDPKPALIEGRNYYQLSFVENAPDAAHRLEDFLVDVDTGEILVMDFATEKPMTIEQWRKERSPDVRTVNRATGG